MIKTRNLFTVRGFIDKIEKIKKGESFSKKE